MAEQQAGYGETPAASALKKTRHVKNTKQKSSSLAEKVTKPYPL
jgi:hypothetical protein